MAPWASVEGSAESEKYLENLVRLAVGQCCKLETLPGEHPMLMEFFCRAGKVLLFNNFSQLCRFFV